MELLRPDSLEAARASLGNGAVPLAGGTELVPLLRDRIVDATALVDIRKVVPRGIDGGPGSPSQAEAWHGTITIGAATTLGELEVDPEVPEALRAACRLAASPQLRAMGTIAGNLLQATRCWYWRLRYPCWLHGGERCFAREGVHREHAVFAAEPCASAHPSDPAAALVALDGLIRTDRRQLRVAELYRLPTDDDRRTTTLDAGELILELVVPAPEASTYLKAMDRRRFAFPLVGVAAARTGSEVRIALSGMAPIPWLLDGAAALDRATPLPQNAYKVEIARALVRRALEEVGA